MTFYQIFSVKGYTIEIPIIQRDYAQGRDTQKENQIRESFLNSIESHLAASKNIDLDFVYGSLEDLDGNLSKFVPLDGQQRLTTLFLLHWYLANRDDNYQEFTKHLISNGRSRFTYKTRISSIDFCNALVIKNVDFKLLGSGGANNNAPSIVIKDSAWYFNAWDHDPTVKSMLHMMDAIHAKFSNSQGYFAKLISAEKPIITFQFMNLENFNLTDDLYIKMNARGKLLTDFEIFKAWLQGFIEKKEWTFQKQDGREWQYRIDQEWTDLFWQYAVKGRKVTKIDIDTPMLNLFKSIGMYELAGKMTIQSSDLTLSDKVKITRLNENEEISTMEYEKWSCFTLDAITKCFRLFDHFTKEANQRNKLTGFVDNKNFTERVSAYAYLLYVTDMPESDCADTSINLEVWMRIADNIVRNTIIDDQVDFVRAVQSLQKVWEKVKQAHDSAKEWTRIAFAGMNVKDISFFKPEQCDEEIKKANLILKEPHWEKRLKMAEDHQYFFGQIGFLLDYAYSGNEYDPEVFDTYANKAATLFSPMILEHNEHLLERGLLTKGDYLIGVGSSNRGFCLPDHGTLRKREENWRKVFRDKTRSLMLKKLLDDLDPVRRTDESLRAVIQGAKELEEWQKLIVECPETIAVCKQGQIRFEPVYIFIQGQSPYVTETDAIYPLVTTRMSGRHYELRTMHLVHKILMPQKDKLKPFVNLYCEYVSGSGDLPYACLKWNYQMTNLELRITYEKKYYRIKIIAGGGRDIPTWIKDGLLKDSYFKQGSLSRLEKESILYEDIENEIFKIVDIFKALK